MFNKDLHHQVEVFVFLDLLQNSNGKRQPRNCVIFFHRVLREARKVFVYFVFNLFLQMQAIYSLNDRWSSLPPLGLAFVSIRRL
jgi:hypothetical protein